MLSVNAIRYSRFKLNKFKTRRRFSVRGLIVAIALAAIFMAWIGQDLFRTYRERSVVAKISAAGGRVVYDHEIDSLRKSPASSI